jgi:hypothetical protein
MVMFSHSKVAARSIVVGFSFPNVASPINLWRLLVRRSVPPLTDCLILRELGAQICRQR